MSVRFATFNVALSRGAPGELTSELHCGSHQARAVAAIIRHLRPDVLFLNEFDYDPVALDLFCRHYLESGHRPLRLPYRYTGPVNTGIPSGHDLDGDGRADGPGDAIGFGTFPGQYGMALLSAHPIDSERIRCFRRFPWRALPGARLPTTPNGGEWFAAALRDILPLSSKSHWDVPVNINGESIHCLLSHPTPPVFDGDEARNYLRNRDEIRFWQAYLDGSASLRDDAGGGGGLAPEDLAIVMGDLNTDALAGAGDHQTIADLAGHPRLQDPIPRSPGARRWQDRARRCKHPDPGRLTSWLGGFGLRLDYVLPDRRMRVNGSGVFWPPPGHRRAHWVGTPERYAASDHRLVWVDVSVG